MYANKLQLNPEKLQIILITTNKTEKENFSITIQNKTIKHSNHVKISGTTMTDDLSYKTQDTRCIFRHQ